MAFNIDMSPLERSSARMGNTFGRIGDTIATAIKDNRRQEQEQIALGQQQQQQEQMRGLMLAAAQGNQQAIEQLHALNPEIASQFERRVLGQQTRARDEQNRLKGERAMATVKVVEQMYRAETDEQRQAIFDAAVDDDRFDIDEEDRASFNNPQLQKDVISRIHLANNPNAKEYLDRFFGDEAEPMTEYQKEMVKGSKIDRELRKAEIENKKIDNQIKRETSKVKLEELRNKKAANEEKQLQIKKGRSDSAQSVVNSGKSTLDLINSIEKHPGFEAAVGAKGISSLFGAVDPISGTDAAGVKALIDTLEAQNFLTAIGEFKSAGGAGALSDNEGKKLSAAISSLTTDQSESDFKKSLNVIKSLVRKQISGARPQIDKAFKLEPSVGEATISEESQIDLSKLSLEELKALRAKG